MTTHDSLAMRIAGDSCYETRFQKMLSMLQTDPSLLRLFLGNLLRARSLDTMVNWLSYRTAFTFCIEAIVLLISAETGKQHLENNSGKISPLGTSAGC